MDYSVYVETYIVYIDICLYVDTDNKSVYNLIKNL